MVKIWQCIIADFKQRTRQQSFMVSLLAMSVLTLLFFPAPEAHYQTLVINDSRGIYNSHWIGVCLAMLNVMFLPIICFYLIKNAIELDRKSMTSELIAATPISKQKFIFAKWCVNVFILISIVLVMLLSSILIQLYYGESYYIDLWALAWPQLIFVLPLLLAIASIAIMFESIKWLRGGAGNIVYFFLWVGSIVQTVESVSGVGALLNQLETEIAQRFPLQQGSTNIGVSINDQTNQLQTFIWQGMEPNAAHLLSILPILTISLICLLLAFIFFDRFSQNTMTKDEDSSSYIANAFAKVSRVIDQVFAAITQHFSFTRLLRLELKLLMKGYTAYWYIGLIILNLLQLFIDQQLLTSLILPISWLWCVLVISQLGQMEKQKNTVELITYSNQSSILQTLASYSAAWVLLALASSGGIIRFMVLAEWVLFIQIVIAISFTVSMAYFCGTFTSTKRMFEVLYPTLWYIGPVQAALYVDFFGVNSQASWQAGIPYYFISLSVGLLLLTLKARSSR